MLIKPLFISALLGTLGFAQAQTLSRALDMPGAPAGEAKDVAMRALRRAELPCAEMLKAERSPNGQITAICKTPGKNPSHVYKDQTRYRIVGKNGVALAQTCHSSAQQPQIVCR